MHVQVDGFADESAVRTIAARQPFRVLAASPVPGAVAVAPDDGSAAPSAVSSPRQQGLPHRGGSASVEDATRGPFIPYSISPPDQCPTATIEVRTSRAAAAARGVAWRAQIQPRLRPRQMQGCQMGSS
jgi:hypothetical protein